VTQLDESAPSGARAAGSAAPSLQGNMGTVALIFTVLACAAPLACVSGVFPTVVGFGGPYAPVAYAIATVILLFFAIGLATMSRHVPNPGAFYAYVTSGLGRPAGLGGAFLAVLAYLLITTASFAFLGSSVDVLVTEFGGPHIAWGWYSLVGVLLTGALGYLNVEFSAKVLSIAMALEVLIVVAFDLIVGVRGTAHDLEAPSVEYVFSAGNMSLAVLFCVLCFIGFESTAIFREEAKDPEKTVPRAMYLSVLLIGVFYIIGIVTLSYAYGGDRAFGAATENPVGMFLDALGHYLGPVSLQITAILLVNSVFASLVALQNMLSRYLYALGNDGVLPKTLGRAHPRHHSPYIASMVVTAAILLLGFPFALTQEEPMVFYAKMVGVGTYSIVILMLLASVAVFAYFRRNRDTDGSAFKTVIAPGLACVGFVGVVYLASTNFTMMTGLEGTLANALVTLVFAVFVFGAVLAVVFRKNRPEVYQRIGRQDL
jgi:amino acid transporter